MQPADRNAIEHFVRVTLGCKCPDEVFESIAVENLADADEGAGHVRLTVGDRLLIYVLEAGDAGGRAGSLAASALRAPVAALVRAGIDERNARRFNRFRLVVSRAGTAFSEDDAAELLASVAGADARAHVHFIDPGDLPGVLRHR